MKKFLILMIMLLVGFGLVFAAPNPAQPPGVAENAAIETPLAEYGVNFGIVSQPAVSVVISHSDILTSPMSNVLATAVEIYRLRPRFTYSALAEKTQRLKRCIVAFYSS